MNYATWADRVVAALIDGGLVLAVVIVLCIIISTLGFAISLGGAALGGADSSSGTAASMFGSSICCIAFIMFPLVGLAIGLYNKVYLVGKRGASIGQGIMKLKVVTAAGSLVPTGTLVLRLLVQVGFGFIPFLPLLSILWPLWDPQRQALHDKAVGTFVIKAE
jgi:uncharacterized RDD family membrane protein YckC